MKTLVLLVLVALCALSVKTQDWSWSKPATVKPADRFNPTPKTTTTTTPKTTTTTTTPKTTTTTTPKTTTTTTPKTTTTTTPKTTTTTTPKTTTTTTPKTTTTTTPVPLTPTPHTPLDVGYYNVTDSKKGVVCLLARMALQIRLSTPKVNGNFNVVPRDTNVTGNCNESMAHLFLNFKEGNISFTFSKNASGNGYVTALSFYLAYPLAKGDTEPYRKSNASVELFVAKLGHSYSCGSNSVYMGNGLYLDATTVQLQAFQVANNKFGSPDYCPSDSTDYRVAIAVGVTLLVLVIIVVVVYFLGRRRRTAGYQSL